MTSTEPKTIADIWDAYRSVCDRQTSLLDLDRRGEAGGDHPDDWLASPDDKPPLLCQVVLIILGVMSPIGALVELEKEVQR